MNILLCQVLLHHLHIKSNHRLNLLLFDYFEYNNLDQIFEKLYNDIFAKLKNFSDFYCGNLNKSQKKIDLKLPNFSLNDDNEKKLSDIIFTVKSLIAYIENNNSNENDKKDEVNDKIKEINELLKQKEKYLNKIKNDNKKFK